MTIETELKPCPSIEVQQADRDAAADLVRNGAPGLSNGNKVIAAEIKGGLHDSYGVVQAFARHRARTSPQPDQETVERVARAIWMTSRTFAELEEDGSTWQRSPEYIQDHYRDLARSAIDALNPPPGIGGEVERLDAGRIDCCPVCGGPTLFSGPSGGAICSVQCHGATLNPGIGGEVDVDAATGCADDAEWADVPVKALRAALSTPSEQEADRG